MKKVIFPFLVLIHTWFLVVCATDWLYVFSIDKPIGLDFYQFDGGILNIPMIFIFSFIFVLPFVLLNIITLLIFIYATPRMIFNHNPWNILHRTSITIIITYFIGTLLWLFVHLEILFIVDWVNGMIEGQLAPDSPLMVSGVIYGNFIFFTVLGTIEYLIEKRQNARKPEVSEG